MKTREIVLFFFLFQHCFSFCEPSQETKSPPETPPFSIHSTLKKKDTREFTRAVEDFSGQMEKIYSVKITNPLSIHLFATRKDFFQFVKQSDSKAVKYAGGFYNPEKNEIAVFWNHSQRETLATLFHEITHVYTALAFKNPPQAIHEGLSAFFEASRLRFHKVDMGRVHRGYLELFLEMAENKSLTPLSSFLDIQGYDLGSMHETFGENQYAEAWALVYYCLRGPEEVQKKFQEYLQFLRLNPDPSGLTFQSLLSPDEREFQKQWIAFMREIKPDKQDRKNKTLQFD